MKRTIRSKLIRLVVKAQIEFSKKPSEYILLALIVITIIIKFDLHNKVWDRTPASDNWQKDFYYRYYDYVEPESAE